MLLEDYKNWKKETEENLDIEAFFYKKADITTVREYFFYLTKNIYELQVCMEGILEEIEALQETLPETQTA